MKNKRFIINLVTNIISYGTTVLVAFILTPYLIRTLGKDMYSFYPLANNFVSYMSILTVALNSMASRFIMIEFIKKNKLGANIYFVSVLYGNIILSLLLGIVMMVIVSNLNYILKIPFNMIGTVKQLFSYIFISMIINILTSVFSVATFIKNRLDIRSYIEIVQGILRIILYVLFFQFLKPSIVNIGVVALILSTLVCFIHIIVNRRLLPEMSFHISYLNGSAIKTILSSGIWNSINQLGAVLISSISLFMCNVLLGANAAGDYSIVQTVPLFLTGVISMLASIFLPEQTKRYAEGKVDSLVKDLHNSQKLMGILTNVPIMIFIAMGTEFFRLWVPGEDAMKLQILSILSSLPILVTGSVWTVTNLFTITNTVKVPSLITNLCGVINVGIMFLLINSTNLGIYSIAISQSIVNILRIGLFIPIYPTLQLKLKKTTFYPIILRTLIAASFNYLIFILLKGIFDFKSWISMIMYAMVCAILGILFSSLFIMKPSNIILYIKEFKDMKLVKKVPAKVDQFDIPIVLFLFKREEKTLQILKMIAEIKPSKLYLIGDGGRTKEEMERVLEIRKQVEKEITWECTVIKNYAKSNRGIYKNIALGAKWVFRQEKMAIFLEDDNLPELTFFRFCKEMLLKYENNKEILWVCGSNYLDQYKTKDGTDYLFTKHLLPCGWASWSDKFLEYYDGELKLFNKENAKNIRKSYMSTKLYEYDMKRFMSEYKRKRRGMDFLSWDYQMAFSLRVHDLYGIVPAINQIKNIGVDNESTHGGSSKYNRMTKRFCNIDTYPLKFPLVHPNNIMIDKKFEQKITKIVLPPSSKLLKTSVKIVRKALFIPDNMPTLEGLYRISNKFSGRRRIKHKKQGKE